MDPVIEDVLVSGLSNWVLQDRQPEKKLKYFNLTGPIVNETQVEILKEKIKERFEFFREEPSAQDLMIQLEELKRRLTDLFLCFIVDEWKLDEHKESSANEKLEEHGSLLDVSSESEVPLSEHERRRRKGELVIPAPAQKELVSDAEELSVCKKGFQYYAYFASWPKNAAEVGGLIEKTIRDGTSVIIIVASIGLGKFGVLVRDCCGTPIIAYSGYDEGSSEFRCEINGVLKAFELVNKYKLPYIRLFCRFPEVADFVGISCQRLLYRCYCQRPMKKVDTFCKSCVSARLGIRDDEEKQKTSNVVWKIMDQLDIFKKDIPKKAFSIHEFDESWKESVDCLVKSTTQAGEMFPWELRKYAEFSEILFKEASGESGCDAFI